MSSIIIHQWELITIKLPHLLYYKRGLEDYINIMDFIIHLALRIQPGEILLRFALFYVT